MTDNSGPYPGKGAPWKYGDWIALGVVILASFLTFSPALRNGFVDWDDGIALLENPHFRGLGPTELRWMWTTFYIAIYRPLTWMTYGADYLVWGLNPLGYHLTNVILHVVNAALVYALCRRLLILSLPSIARGAPLVLSAVVATLAFSIHPLRVEPVAWVSARADLLSSMFLLCSVLAYVRSPGYPGYVPSLGLYALSLLAKPSALSYPVILLILDVFPLRRFRENAWRCAYEKIPFLGLAAAALLVIVAAKADVLVPVAGSNLLLALTMSSFGLAFHLMKIVAPFNLSPLYPLPNAIALMSAPFAMAATVVASISVILGFSYRRWPGLLAAWLCYAALILPTAGILPFGPQIAADRYTYLGSIAVSILAGAAVLHLAQKTLGRRNTVFAVYLGAGVVLVTLASLAWRQTHIWRDSRSLWSHAVAITPDSAMANNALGKELSRERRFDEAAPYLRKVTELSPDDALNRASLAAVYLNQGKLQQAREQLLKAIELSPGLAEAHYAMGVLLLLEGQPGAAAQELRKAIEIKPDYADAKARLESLSPSPSR